MGRMKELYFGKPSFAEMQSDYLVWLGNLVEAEYQKFGKWHLLHHLQDTEFYWTHPMDANRCSEGLQLRELYLEETGNLAIAVDDTPCSVLEVMVALAIRMDELLSDNNGDTQIPKMFWEMIDNLGLSFVNDENYYEESIRQEIDDILERFLSRDYGHKGVGSLFPLKNSRKQQNNAELWYQLNNYLMDRYYLDIV